MVSCLESLLGSSKDVHYPLTCEDLKLIFHLGYEVQSTLLCDIIEGWLLQRTDIAPSFVDALLSFDVVWRSTTFTKFEARIFGNLLFDSDDLSAKVGKKLSICETDLNSIASVLCLGKLFYNKENEEVGQKRSLQNALRTFLNRSSPLMERVIKEGDSSDTLWEIIPEFILLSDDVDLEKWLGKICHFDLEDLNPKGSRAVKAVLDKDRYIFHRHLPGWVIRTFSRLTRRFAEDKTLSEPTLKSVVEFGMLHSVTP
jgi:hypothetical protein